MNLKGFLTGWLAIVTLFVILAACSTVTYTGHDGVTVSYTRFLAGSEGIKVTLGDRSVAEINQQKVDTELLKSVLGAALGAAK